MPEELEPVDPSSATRPDAAGRAREVFAYIAALPESFRDALIAVDVVGLSYGEAAKALGTKEGDHHVALVPCTRSGRSRDGSDPSERPIEISRGSPDQDIPVDPLDDELAERGRALIAAAVAETAAPLALRERIEADRARARQTGGARRSRGVLGMLVPAAGLVAAVVVALVLVLGGSNAPSVLATASLATRVRSCRTGRGRPPTTSAQGVDRGHAFPYWGDLLPVGSRGARDDKIKDRAAKTVYYQQPQGRRARPTRSSAATRSTRPRAPRRRPERGQALHHADKGRRIVTWTRNGHTCVLSAPVAVPEDKLLSSRRGRARATFPSRRSRSASAPGDAYQRATILLVLLAQLLAAQQPRGGPVPARARPGSARLPRRSLPPHGTVAGRRARG
jgi:hypothetical protein